MGTQKVSLAWDANDEADIAGYMVHYGAQSRQYTQTVDVGNITSATISNLVERATYYFAVTAYNSSGLESDFSNEVSYDVPAPALTFSCPNSITINDFSAATPYPSTVLVSGLAGTIGKLTVTLNNFHHGWPRDVGVLLAGPEGQTVELFANVGGGDEVDNATLTFDDAASDFVPAMGPLLTGAYKPSNEVGKYYPVPAPPGPYGTTLAEFVGTNPNGVWSLYVVDDAIMDGGVIADGWSMHLTTVPVAAPTFANPETVAINDFTSATPYPSTAAVSGVNGIISKVTVTLNGFSHAWPHDVGALLVGPAGQGVVLLANVGAGNEISNVTLTLDDDAEQSLPTDRPISSGTYKPTDILASKFFPAPAPPGPYGAGLFEFNGTDPNGTWSLYVVDDGYWDDGVIRGGWSVSITTMDLPRVAVQSEHGLGNSATDRMARLSETTASALIINHPVILEAAPSAGPQQFEFHFNGKIGQRYAIQASTDSSHWSTIGVVTSVHENTSFADTKAGRFRFRFYRVVQVAAPSEAADAR
ncbi:MAG: fibronectin type III domain-containing protein [Candidatus Omnitrophica bacterium]|nr:fibronectin type III domain-containing protein [Candidatus Omnitrophota bacterium]